MTLTSEAEELLKKEELSFKKIISSLDDQLDCANIRLRNESIKASGLTFELVSTRRDEDKQTLASGEAVSHGIRDMKEEELKSIESLKKKPYFAHLILHEDDGRKIEFFLGTHSNTDCRIIDWRKAPISKLYYEYKEGEEYFEEIQGSDRSGTIALRNKVEIQKGILKSVNCRHGTFYLEDGKWVSTNKNIASSRNYAQLPDVLSLITADQFRTITEAANTAILIQGVAGSGKTTVALHRLSWLLHADNSNLKSEEAVIIVKSSALAAYIESGLDSLELSNIKVFTYPEWCSLTLRNCLPKDFISDNKIRRPQNKTPFVIKRVLASMAVFKVFENKIKTEKKNILLILLDTLRDYHSVLSQEDIFLIDKESLLATADYLQDLFRRNTLDTAVDGLIVFACELINQYLTLPSGLTGKYQHIVVDEVQDYSAGELASLVGAVSSLNQLTLVGDVNQAIGAEGAFIGWDKLRKHWNFNQDLSQFVSLTVSHRSTIQIMKLATYVCGVTADSLTSNNKDFKGKSGQPPIWFHCCDENQSVSEAISWLTRVSEKFPNSLAVVLCRTMKEAQYLYGLLKPAFSHSVRLGDDSSFSFEEGIVVTSVAMVKGLEFPHVLIWNPSARNYQNSVRDRNILYVAITRAEDHLALITWGETSPILPSLYSKYVRGFDRVMEAREMAKNEMESRYDR